MKKLKLKAFILFTIYCLLFTVLAGCTTVSRRPPKGIKGVYHNVRAGETLWRISQAYGIELDKIATTNQLADTSRIYIGQLIFIPGATTTAEDLTLESDFKDKGGNFVWPLKGRVTSFFGMKKNQVVNKGIYIQTKKSTYVTAARSGKVVFCSEGLKGYGKTIIIDHLDGYSTVYAHNSQNLVKLKQLVNQGQAVSKAGRRAGVERPELYFEIRKGAKPQNPFFYLP